MAAPSAEPAATGAGAIEQLAAYGKILETMSHFSTDQVINLDLNDTDVISRNTFRKTNLYWSFCEHTFQLLMKEAQEKFATSERSGPTRFCYQDLLVQACEVGATLTKGHADTAATAKKFFDSDTPGDILCDAFLVEPAKISLLLKGFAPMAPITLACQLLLAEHSTSIYSNWTFPKFVVGAEYLIAQDVTSQHPIVNACLTLMHSLGSASPGLKFTEIEKPLVSLQ